MRPRSILPAATLAVLAAAAPAGAHIVPGRSIHGVHPGMTLGQVRARLGHGREDRQNPGTYYFRHDRYTVIFDRRHVTSIITFTAAERTPRGVHVGTTRAELARAYPGLECQTVEASSDCYLGSPKRGHRYTDFYLNDGTVVTAISVGDGFQ